MKNRKREKLKSRKREKPKTRKTEIAKSRNREKPKTQKTENAKKNRTGILIRQFISTYRVCVHTRRQQCRFRPSLKRIDCVCAHRGTCAAFFIPFCQLRCMFHLCRLLSSGSCSECCAVLVVIILCGARCVQCKDVLKM